MCTAASFREFKTVAGLRLGHRSFRGWLDEEEYRGSSLKPPATVCESPDWRNRNIRGTVVWGWMAVLDDWPPTDSVPFPPVASARPRAGRLQRGLSMKSFAKVGLLVLALLVPAATADARPYPGKWEGGETRWLGKQGVWHNYNLMMDHPVAFKVKRGKVSAFKAQSYAYDCDGLGDQPEPTPVEEPTPEELAVAALSIRVTPRVGKLKRRGGGRFVGTRSSKVAGRTLLVVVSGRFNSKGRASGKLGVALSGCVNTYTSAWKTKGTKPTPKRRSGGGEGGDRGGTYCPPRIVRDAYGNSRSVPGYYSPGGYCA